MSYALSLLRSYSGSVLAHAGRTVGRVRLGTSCACSLVGRSLHTTAHGPRHTLKARVTQIAGAAGAGSSKVNAHAAAGVAPNASIHVSAAAAAAHADQTAHKSMAPGELAFAKKMQARAQTQRKTVLLVLGGTGQFGNKIVQAGLSRDRNVVATTRSANFRGLSEAHPYLNWIHTPHVKDTKAWVAIFEKMIKDGIIHEGDAVEVVNTMGGAHGKCLIDVNVAPTLAAADAMMDITERCGIAFKVVHMSSIASGLLTDAYGRSKQMCDRELMSRPFESLSVFRVGYTVNPLQRNERGIVIDNEHHYSPEQVAQLYYQFIIGNGEQPIQPLLIPDLIENTFLSFNHKGAHSMDAVGSNVLTQLEFFKFYRERLLGKQFRPWHIHDFSRLHILAKHFPLGHFAPYAIEYLQMGGKVFDHRLFETRLQRPLMNLEDAHPTAHANASGEIVMSRVPLVKHVGLAFNKMVACGDCRRDMLKLVLPESLRNKK